MPRVIVRIPAPLRGLAGGADEVQVHADTVGDAIAALGGELAGHIGTGAGPDGPRVMLYLGADEVAPGGLGRPVQDGDVLAIVPRVAGARSGHRAGRRR